MTATATRTMRAPDFIRDRDFVFPSKALLGALRTAGRPGGVATFDATRLASALLGDPEGLPADWPDVAAVVEVDREREVGGKRTVTSHYYLSSYAGKWPQPA